MTKLKYIDLKEFQEFGYLQEVNRRFLHPLGLALVLGIDENVYSLVGFVDARDDPEGIRFDEVDADKAALIYEQEMSRMEFRKERLGYWIQPVSEEEKL